MTLVFRRWTCISYLITSAITLITISIETRAEVVSETEYPFLIRAEIPKKTSPKLPETTCPVAYSECRDDKLCLGYWDITNECHRGYTNVEIIAKCQDFVEADFINDTALFAPMTSAERNITYLNVYCGICNFEKELFKFEFWTPWLFVKNSQNQSSDTKDVIISTRFTQPVNSTEMLEKLKLDDSNDLKFISPLNETIDQCKVLRVVPDHLKTHVKFCPAHQNAEKASMTFQTVTTIRKSFSRLLNQNYSDPDGTKFCSIGNSSMESFCDYKDEYGDTCSVNSFLSDVDSVCGGNGYILWKSFEDEDILAQCSNRTSKQNHIYICGPSKPNLYKKIKTRIFNVMDHISAFFLFLYLALSTSKQNLRSLPKRVFYSYSATLFVFYVFEFPLRYVESCVIKYYVFFYIWQSHSFWILITAFDLWRLVYSSLKIRKVNVEGQTVKYVVYCILGWGLPALILVALFPTLTENQKLWSCPSVSGFENELICSSSCDLNKYTFNFGWVTIIIFLVLAPLLLILTCVLVCVSTRNTARSNVNRTYTIVLFKVAIMMGLHWMLLVYLTLFDSGERFSLVYEFISSFLGCFIFFAFGLEKNNLNMVKRVVSGRVTERTRSTTVSRSTIRGTSTWVSSEQF